jgi:hypothetical protein
VALCVKNGDDNLFEVEGTTKHGPNVIAFHLETGGVSDIISLALTSRRPIEK